DCAIFEAVHGSAPDIAGKNLANPSSVILASVQMLEYLGMSEQADKIVKALADVIESGDRTTRDLGGSHGTTDFTDAVIERL
ncbi:MAG: isocitrate dehydrogenase, partial [Idiomarina sp.]